VKKTRTPMPRLLPAGLGKRLALAALLGAMVPVPVHAGDPVTNRLGKLAVRETDASTEIVVTCTDAPTFTVFKLNDPIRLFIDVSNADTAQLNGPVEIDNGVVGEVSALQFNDSQATVGRIIVGLEVDALYKVQASGNQLVVTVDASQRKRKAVPLAAAPDPGAAVQLAALESRAAEAERRARDAEDRARTLDSQARTAEARAAEIGRDAEQNRQRAAKAESERAVAEKSAEQARADKVVAEAAAEKARAEKATAEAAAEKARAEKIAAEAVAERATARAAADKAAAEKAAADRNNAQAAAEKAARRASELEAVAARSAAGSRDGERARAEAEAARKAAEKAAAEKIAAEKTAADALARAQSAESRAHAAESDRRKLQDELAALDAQRQQSIGRIAALEAAQGELARQVDAARRQSDETTARRLEAEQVAREAELKAQRAEVARLESAKATSALDTRTKALQADAEAAKVAGANETSRKSLDDATQELGRLKEQLRTREAELQAAREEARRSRDAADALPGRAPAAVAVAAAAQPAVAPQKLRISDVRFEDKADRTEIRVRVEGRPEYTLRSDGERTRILELADALIDPSLERSLDTGAFPSAVQLVSSFQAAGNGDRVRVVATLRDRVADRVKVDGNTLVWSFDKPARSQADVAAAEVEYARPQAAVYAGLAQNVSAAEANSSGDGERKKKKRYTGRKINIDIKDADIHNVLRLLAKEGNINIVTSDNVSGAVTVHLKMVPWDQALDLVLRSKSLDMVQEGNIVRVAKAEDIKAERDRELQAQEQRQKLKPVNVKLISVNHAVAGELLSRVQSVLTERGKAEFDTRTNTVIIKDVDESLEAAEDLVRRLDTQTPQVLIEARIVEVNTNSEQQFGIQWGGDKLWSGATGNPTGLYFPSVVGISGAADDAAAPTEGTGTNPNFIVNMPTPIGSGAGGGVGFTLGSVDGTFNLNVRLSAAESQGQVKIVSSPKITTLDNNAATISQGVSIPISQVSAAGVNTVFFDAVLSLKVKPHVTQDGNIYLDLEAENNTPDFQNVGARGDPTILKKNAKTNVLLKDGDTTVIGGIYTSNGGFSRAEVPFFARIPILGVLFRNHRESDRRTELLIFITPRIVNRAAASVRTTP
jgi:type IV pilus assembly protein PilQ